eukprot:9350273-Pyramimonas_sp.AAC.1
MPPASGGGEGQAIPAPSGPAPSQDHEYGRQSQNNQPRLVGSCVQCAKILRQRCASVHAPSPG